MLDHQLSTDIIFWNRLLNYWSWNITTFIVVSYCAYNFGYFLRVIRFWLCLQICAQLSSQLFLWQCLSSKLSSLVNSY